MIKDSANLCSALVLLAITFAVASDTNISYQIGELNNKLTYLQGRLDLFDHITDGNVSVLQHRVEVNDSKCAENVTKHMNESNWKLTFMKDKINSHDNKLNTLEDKLDALTTAVTNLAGDIKEILLKPLSSCEDAYKRPPLNRGSGVYNIQLNGNSSSFDVYCMTDPKGGLPWTVVQRRVDGSVNFYRNWAEYQKGFGDLEKNFFIGLDNLHSLTTKGGPQELWVSLIDRNGITTHAYYDAFAIGNEADKYALNVLGAYSGDAGDSLTYHKGKQFSTYDKPNHMNYANCAENFKSAWWFGECYHSNCHQCSHLNGVYGSTQEWGGLTWNGLRPSIVSKKYAHMAIRPARK